MQRSRHGVTQSTVHHLMLFQHALAFERRTDDDGIEVSPGPFDVEPMSFVGPTMVEIVSRPPAGISVDTVFDTFPPKGSGGRCQSAPMEVPSSLNNVSATSAFADERFMIVKVVRAR